MKLGIKNWNLHLMYTNDEIVTSVTRGRHVSTRWRTHAQFLRKHWACHPWGGGGTSPALRPCTHSSQGPSGTACQSPSSCSWHSYQSGRTGSGFSLHLNIETTACLEITRWKFLWWVLKLKNLIKHGTCPVCNAVEYLRQKFGQNL